MRQPGFWIVLILVALGLKAGAQESTGAASPPLRIEIPAGSDNETYRVVACGTRGLVVFYQSIEVDESQRIRWFFTLYDKNLQPLWTKGVPLIPGMLFRKSELKNDTLCMYFQTDQKNRETGSKFQVVRAILEKGTFIINSGALPDGAEFAFFREFNQKVYTALNIHNDIGQLMVVDLPTGNLSLTPMGAGSQTTFLALAIDSANTNVLVLVQKYVSKRLADNFMVTLNQDGKILSEMPINTISAERQLSGATFVNAGSGNMMIAGNYVLSDALLSDKYNLPVKKATGFFTTTISSQLQQTLNFYNFLDLGSVKAMLSERDLIALRKKTMKKNQSGQETSGDFYALLHDAVTIDRQVVVVAELFYPQYHTETFSDFDFYGRPITNSYSVFDGFRFTHAIAAGFDPQGTLLWDNFIEFRNLVTTDLNPRVILYPQDDGLIMAYSSEGKIASKLFRNKQPGEKTEYSEIALTNSTDKLLKESRSQLLPWYENFFISCGYQEIKDIAKGNDAKRLVFYCTKILAE